VERLAILRGQVIASVALDQLDARTGFIASGYASALPDATVAENATQGYVPQNVR